MRLTAWPRLRLLACCLHVHAHAYAHAHAHTQVYGGHKCDFDGNKKISSDNIHAFPSVYGTTCLNIGAQSLPPEGYAEGCA